MRPYRITINNNHLRKKYNALDILIYKLKKSPRNHKVADSSITRNKLSQSMIILISLIIPLFINKMSYKTL